MAATAAGLSSAKTQQQFGQSGRSLQQAAAPVGIRFTPVALVSSDALPSSDEVAALVPNLEKNQHVTGAR